MLSKLFFAYIAFFAITSALSVSALFDVQDLCAYLTVDCLLAVSVFCTPIFNQYCTCIRADLDLNVAILLDASVGVQTSSLWTDLTLAIPSALQLEIQAAEPLLDIDILAFGDGNVLDISANLDVAFPSFTNALICPALLQAAASLSIGVPDVIVLIVWSNLDLTGCDLSLLVGLRLYIISFGLNLDFSALQAAIIANGGSVVIVNYCSSLLCLQNLISIDIDVTVQLVVSILGDLFCQIFTVTTTGAVTTTTTTTTPATTTPSVIITTPMATTTTTTTTTTSTTPAPIIPPLEITPSPTKTPTTPSPLTPPQEITPPPTKTYWNTPSPVAMTPSPLTPPQEITPSPTRRTRRPTRERRTRRPTPPPTTKSPSMSPTPRPSRTRRPTPRPTRRPTRRPTTPAPVTPAPVTPSPIVPPQQITPSPTQQWAWSG